jgi:hypothetical protein
VSTSPSSKGCVASSVILGLFSLLSYPPFFSYLKWSLPPSIVHGYQYLLPTKL